MYVIGLTGGVGSGKSVVAKLIRDMYNVELLIADDLGHMLMEKGTDGFRDVVSCFGDKILASDGSIDRGKLAEVVFGNSEALEKMNAIIHPKVKKYISDYISDRQDMRGVILLESAILYETGCDELCNEVWYVFVPRKIRIKRLEKGRGYTVKKAESIMDRQQPDEFYFKRADCVIENGGTMEELKESLKSELHKSQN